jgi:hypothetical protein
MHLELSENQVAVKLLRFYQQKGRLENNAELDFTENGKQTTLDFYNENINALRIKLDGINPERLAKIDKQRAVDFAFKEN